MQPAVPGGFPGYAVQVALPPAPPVRLQPNFADQTTTVYVGHICNRVPDGSMKELLDICGQVTKWNRQPDPVSGKSAHFGFCEFKKLEGAWRAVELLNDKQLGSRKLVVKADAKIQERIAEFSLSHRFQFENEHRLRATVEAMLTTINAQWKEEAVARDSEIQQPLAPDRPRPEDVSEKQASADIFPPWYRESRRESERLRRIERLRKDRMHDFERALRRWEHDEKRLIAEYQRDIQDVQAIAEEKRKLIEQDCGDKRVVSGFSSSERRREVEADQRDRENEEKELIQKRQKDEAELVDLQERLSFFSKATTQTLYPTRARDDRPVPDLPHRIRETVRKLPLATEDIKKVDLDWSNILSEQTLMKLRSWLKRKLTFVGCSEDEAQALSRFVCKSLEVHKKGSFEFFISKIAQCSRLHEDLVAQIAKKCMQMLIFTQIINR